MVQRGSNPEEDLTPVSHAPSRTGRLCGLGLLAGALLAQATVQLAALEPTTALANFNRQTWVMENGLPQNTVQALAQTSDGFVWLGTEVGLVRFDGSGFSFYDHSTKLALPGNDVRCLLATADGSLWVGTSDGLARIRNGSSTTYTTAQGLPGNGIVQLSEDDRQHLWAFTNEGAARLDIERFTAGENSHAASPILLITAHGGTRFWKAGSANADSGGTGWQEVAGRAGLPLDSVEFVAELPVNTTAVGSKSVLAIARLGGGVLRLSPGKELPGSRIQAVLADREGSLWIGTNGGLTRYAEGKLERLPVTDPLASASVLTLLEDREGNLWVGTEEGGLHILRDQRFHTLTTREGLSSDDTTTVVQDSTGILWVGTGGGGLTALKPGNPAATRTYGVREGLASDVILSLAAAPDGDLWIGTPDGLSRMHQGKVSSYTSADGLPDDFIRSLLVDKDGSLWIGTRRGLAHWISPSRMETLTEANGLGNDLVGAMERDAASDLWVATFAGLSRIHEGHITNFTTANGLSSNVITALLPRRDGTLLIGTQDHGWNQWDGSRFSQVTQSNLAQTSIHAILDDRQNHLWFATGDGIARCDCDTAMGRMKGADCSHWIEFGSADGLRTRETAINSHPSAWISKDGLLWFATPKGLVEIDPAHFPVNTIPPPVAIERFAVDDTEQTLHPTEAWLKVPAGHNHFQFDYAAMSFVAPQKVRYRYMLEGFDHGWTEAGARRTAYYTNIPPGHYTFRVQAANNDGVWNTQGAALQFELRPHFYQTIWFYVLLGIGVAGVVLLLLRLRLLRAEREFGAVLGERNRIAREIHDTLAQGYVGISVQLEVMSELLRHNKVEAASKHLDTTRGYVREGLADARQSIWALRSQDSGETTLPVRVRRLVEEANGHGLEASFRLYGAYRSMSPGTEREFLRVAQEAIHNVKKHAEASTVTVQLEYSPSEIALEVRDDGRGFVPSNHGHRGQGSRVESTPGHYGLTGMHERAAAVGGTLEVNSAPGAGTTVRLRAPAPKEIKE